MRLIKLKIPNNFGRYENCIVSVMIRRERNFLSDKKLLKVINLECIIGSKALQCCFQCDKEFIPRVACKVNKFCIYCKHMLEVQKYVKMAGGSTKTCFLVCSVLWVVLLTLNGVLSKG